jgi:cobalt-zinc-cadmium efflux system protein
VVQKNRWTRWTVGRRPVKRCFLGGVTITSPDPGWTRWAEPAVSLIICIVIIWGSWSLLKDSVRMSLAAVSPGLDASKVRGYLQERPGVARLHDLHIWPMSTTETALTCHLVMPGGHPGDPFSRRSRTIFSTIGHVTIQIETSESNACALEPDNVV